MKRALCVIATICIVAAIVSAAVINHNRNAHALWLNYRVNDAGTISLIRPDLPENKQPQVNLIGFVQLPANCWGADMENWQLGEHGSITLGDGWCKVDRYKVYSEEEAVVHYRELKEWLQARQKR